MPKVEHGNWIVDLNVQEREAQNSCYTGLYFPYDPVIVHEDGKVERPFYHPSRFAQSKANEELAIITRVLKEQRDDEGRVVMTESRYKQLQKFIQRTILPYFHKYEEIDFADFMKERGYSGAKRERYERAYDQYLKEGLSLKDAYISAFLKDENQHTLHPTRKEPRLVQSRGYKYALKLGMHLHGFEKQLYKVKGWSIGVAPSYVFGKGHNNIKRAKVLRAKCNQFSKPQILMLDLTAFDATIKRHALMLEHGIYTKFNTSKEFSWLLKQQLQTTGYTMHYKYHVGTGGRCSGDFNTSCGNALIMATFLYAAMTEYSAKVPGFKFDMYCDGDDTLIITEEDTLDDQWLSNFFRDCGMILRVEGKTSTFEEISWCQQNPVKIRGKYRMTPNFRKRISHLMASPKMTPGYMRSLADAELLLSNGVPILGAFSRLLDRSTMNVTPTGLDPGQEYYYKKQLKHLGRYNPRDYMEPDDEARASFHKAFGVSPVNQILMEVEFNNMVLDPSSKIGTLAQKWEDVVSRYQAG